MTTGPFKEKITSLPSMSPQVFNAFETVTDSTDETMEADVKFVNGVVRIFTERINGIFQMHNNLLSNFREETKIIYGKGINVLRREFKPSVPEFLFKAVTEVHPDLFNYYDLDPKYSHLSKKTEG